MDRIYKMGDFVMALQDPDERKYAWHIMCHLLWNEPEPKEEECRPSYTRCTELVSELAEIYNNTN